MSIVRRQDNVGMSNVDAEGEIRTLYRLVLERWNARDAAGMAALFSEHAHVIGFDGSDLGSRAMLERSLSQVFAHHQTPPYVSKARSVRVLGDVAILRGVVGMVPPGQTDLNPDLNAIQTFVASRGPDGWRGGSVAEHPRGIPRPSRGARGADAGAAATALDLSKDGSQGSSASRPGHS